MATLASPEFNLEKNKSIGGEKTNWEFGDAQGAGKSATKDVAAASGVTKKSEK